VSFFLVEKFQDTFVGAGLAKFFYAFKIVMLLFIFYFLGEFISLEKS